MIIGYFGRMLRQLVESEVEVVDATDVEVVDGTEVEGLMEWVN